MNRHVTDTVSGVSGSGLFSTAAV